MWKHLQLPVPDGQVVPPDECAQNGFMYVGAEYCSLPSGPKKRRRPNRNNRSKKKKKNKGGTLAAEDEVDAALDEASEAGGSGAADDKSGTQPTDETSTAATTQRTPSTIQPTNPPPTTPPVVNPAPSTVVPSPPSGTELNIPTFFDLLNGLINSLPCGNLITRHRRRELAATAVGLATTSINAPTETAPLRPKDVFRPVPLSSDPRARPVTPAPRAVSPPPKSGRTSISSTRPTATDVEDQPGDTLVKTTVAPVEPTAAVDPIPAPPPSSIPPPTPSSATHDNFERVEVAREEPTRPSQEYVVRDEIIVLLGTENMPRRSPPPTTIADSPALSPVASPMVSTPVRVSSFESLDEMIVFPMKTNDKPKPEQTCFCETCCNPPDRWARLDDTDIEEDEEEDVEVDTGLQWQLV